MIFYHVREKHHACAIVRTMHRVLLAKRWSTGLYGCRAVE
jgi:hypothetical protein